MKALIGWTLVVLLWFATLASGQTLITSTTISASMTSVQTSLLVSSASGAWTVGNYAYIDYEVLRITNVNGTLIGVSRAQFGTRAVTHASGTTILAGAVGHFKNLAQYLHAPPVASCVRADQPYLPIIDYTSGNIWSCSVTSAKWVGTNTAQLTYNSIMTPNYGP